MKTLFAFDFDNTIIDDDSDHYILKCLAQDLLQQTKEMSAAGGQWTDICNWSVGELFKRGVTPIEISKIQRTIPFNPLMKQFMKLIHSQNHDVLVISDANTIYIDEISQEKGIDGYLKKVITNPAHYDDAGRLHISRFTSTDQHCCPRCPPNLCKGRELRRFIQESQIYDRIVYIGDGANDFCPSITLSVPDDCMPRKGYRFSELLKEDKNRELIVAKVTEWETASDLLERFST